MKSDTVSPGMKSSRKIGGDMEVLTQLQLMLDNTRKMLSKSKLEVQEVHHFCCHTSLYHTPLSQQMPESGRYPRYTGCIPPAPRAVGTAPLHTLHNQYCFQDFGSIHLDRMSIFQTQILPHTGLLSKCYN